MSGEEGVRACKISLCPSTSGSSPAPPKARRSAIGPSAWKARELLGPHEHPEVSMHTHSLAEYMECIYRGRLAGRGRADALVREQARAASAPIS